MKYYSIKDLETYSGIKAHTIRIWEKRYQLLVPDRTDSNIRQYSDIQLKKLLNIAALRASGMRISMIGGLSAEDLAQKVMALEYEYSEQNYDVQINSLIAAIFEYDEARIQKIFSSSFLRLGMMDTFIHIVNPLMHRLGIMWSAGTIHPGHEHFFSHIYRQKIISAMDQLHEPIISDHRFLLFLPNNEYHELGLLLASFMIKQAGHRVLYLGHSIPNDALLQVISEHQPSHLVCANPSRPCSSQLPSWLVELSSAYQGRILFAAPHCQCLPDCPEHISILHSFHTLQEYL